MIKLRFDRTDIKVFQEGRVTKCYLQCQIVETETGNTLEKFKATGKAVCCPQDWPDPKLGAALAESRARYKAYSHAEKFIQGFLKAAKLYACLDFYNQMWYMTGVEANHERALLGLNKKED